MKMRRINSFETLDSLAPCPAVRRETNTTKKHMKTTCFHGTNADNLPSILTHGLLASPDSRVWSVSENAVYCWHPDTLVETGETEEEYSKERAFQFAFESAQISLGKSKDCRAVVIEFEIDSDDLEPDESCENMETARCYRGDIPLSAIKKISISNDLSLLKVYLLSFLINRDYAALELTDLEKRLASKVAENIYPEDVDEITTWEEKEFVA